MRAVLAACALGAFSTGLVAKDATPAVYTGTLGKQPIVLQIQTGDDGRLSGSYFYTRHHRDLALEGSAKDNSIELSEGAGDDDSARPHLELKRNADGSLSGTWQSPQGKSLPISLQVAKAPAPAADANAYLQKLYGSDLYGYLRLSGLSLQKGKTQSFMGHTLQWWVEPDSKVTLFEILDGYPDAQRKQINAVLRSRQWTEVSAFYDCLSNAGSLGGDFEQTITPHLLSPNVISISVFTSYDCGGAHPDFGDSPINLDARTAQELKLADVLWVGDGAPHDTSADGPADNKLASWLAEQLTALYPSKMKDDDCDYSDASVWDYPSWYLTSKGMSFTPSFARAMRVCEANDDWSEIPYRITNKHPGRLHLTLP